jgi:hypothetical protein
MDYPPPVPLARLYEKRSRKGAQYFVGHLGLGKIVLLQSDEISESGEPIWTLQVQEPVATRPAPKLALAARASSLFLAPQKSPDRSSLPSDPVDDLWRDRPRNQVDGGGA